MLDLNRLRVLHEVARAGSFSAAARALSITPSAASQQIAALERSLGVAVVTRGPRGVRVTPPGHLLAEAAAGMIADLSQIERHVDAFTEGVVGRLAVATFPSAGQALLPTALAPLTARPQVEVTVREAETEDALPLVGDGDVDLGLVYHFFAAEPPRQWSGALSYTPLLREEMYAALPARHALRDAEEITLGELADERWIMGIGECGRQVEQYLRTTGGFEPKIACRSGDYGFAQTLAAGGVGVTLVPSLALALQLPGICFVPVRSRPVRHVGVVRRRERWQPPLAAELERLLHQTAAALDRPGLRPPDVGP
jgi:molybdate transport repressor ModE-like protein